MPILKDAVYPFPDITPKFLGTVVQNYRPRGGVPASGFQVWINKIDSAVHDKLVPALTKVDMMLQSGSHAEQHVEEHRLVTIPDFNSLVAISQTTQTPVFELTKAQIDRTGPVLKQMIQSRDKFRDLFSGLADRIIGLTKLASCD